MTKPKLTKGQKKMRKLISGYLERCQTLEDMEVLPVARPNAVPIRVGKKNELRHKKPYLYTLVEAAREVEKRNV